LTGIPSTADLLIGMPVTGIVGGSVSGNPSVIPANTTIAEILSPTSVRLSNNLPAGTFVTGGTITIGNFNRTFTLTGGNTGNNFMRPLINNATQGTVGITKQGIGKWILTNANTYSGPTAVEEGTLLINGNQTGGSAYSVAAGATLGGTGTLGGVGASLVNDGNVAPGESVGTLTVGGAYTQNSGGNLAIEMTGAATFDKLVVNGAASLAGTINVDLQSFTPGIGQTFDILTATSVANNGLTVTGDGNWTVSVFGGNTLRLTFNSLIQAVPEPGTLALVLVGLLFTSRRRHT
jgi:autotransporter-associated beta strand protein